jgi:hypothetical protein
MSTKEVDDIIKEFDEEVHDGHSGLNVDDIIKQYEGGEGTSIPKKPVTNSGFNPSFQERRTSNSGIEDADLDRILKESEGLYGKSSSDLMGEDDYTQYLESLNAHQPSTGENSVSTRRRSENNITEETLPYKSIYIYLKK